MINLIKAGITLMLVGMFIFSFATLGGCASERLRDCTYEKTMEKKLICTDVDAAGTIILPSPNTH